MSDHDHSTCGLSAPRLLSTFESTQNGANLKRNEMMTF